MLLLNFNAFVVSRVNESVLIKRDDCEKLFSYACLQIHLKFLRKLLAPNVDLKCFYRVVSRYVVNDF